jgi:hypothetical protein
LESRRFPFDFLGGELDFDPEGVSFVDSLIAIRPDLENAVGEMNVAEKRLYTVTCILLKEAVASGELLDQDIFLEKYDFYYSELLRLVAENHKAEIALVTPGTIGFRNGFTIVVVDPKNGKDEPSPNRSETRELVLV